MNDEEPLLSEILTRFDQVIEPIDDREVHAAVEQLRKREMEAGLGYPMASVAECAAFMFCPDYHWQGDGWDSYYGPMFGWTNDDGKAVHSPDINQFQIDTFCYWEKRAREARHPILKTRYADLCWEFQKRITGVAADIDMARIVVDATVDATRRQLVKHQVDGRKKLARALAIARAIGDAARIDTVRDAIVDYEDAIARDDAPGLWGFAFDLIIDDKKVPKTPELEAKIIGDLEGRLRRLSSPDEGKAPDPWGSECAALRLARYYRRCNKPEDVRRVLKAYGAAFEQIAQGASGMQASGWLQSVHAHFREFGLNAEAETVLLKVREYAKKSRDEMAVHTDKIEIPKQEMDQFLEHVTRGTLSESLHRTAVEFVADKERIVEQIKRMRESAPLVSMLPLTIVDHEGRPTSHIGSVDSDIDGRIAHQISQNMRYGQMFLVLTLNHIRAKYSVSADDLLNHFRQSPVFPEDGMSMLRAGLDAYLRDDHLAAAHLLVPQIESAVRHLLHLCGGNLWKPHRGGGLVLKNLEDLFREEAVVASLKEDTVLTLRVTLTDQRGWNLRNGICHGLLTAESFGRGMTDRLLHCLLLLSLVRQRPAEQKPPSE